MIDWQIMVGFGKWSKFPDGYDRFKDGAWFPDFHYQELLLPHFHTGKCIVDEYGTTVFSGEELNRLELQLHWLLEKYEGLVEKRWTVTTQFDGDEKSTVQIFEGQVICELLEKTLKMIAKAKSLNAQIAFFGD